MCFDFEGSSPSQMIAVWSPRLSRWRSMQFQATLRTPSSNHLIEMLPGAKETFSTLCEGLDPVDALGLFGPEAVGIRDRAGIHLAVFGVVDKGALGPIRGYVVNFLGHFSLHSLRPPTTRRPQAVLIVAMIMRRGAIAGQGGNVCDLGRPVRLSALSRSIRPSLSRFGRAKNQRYRANGSHDRYLVTVNNGIGTRKAGRYPLNGQPGAGRPSGTKPQQPALPADRWSKAITVMMDQQSFEATRPVSADPAVALAEALGQLPKPTLKAPGAKLAHRSPRPPSKIWPRNSASSWATRTD